MKQLKRGFRVARGVAIIAALALAPAPGWATGVFVINFPWARPALKGGTTEAFMDLTSADGGTLVGARSELAGKSYVVGPGKAGAAVERLSLPAGAPVVLAPGSYRVRLSGLARALKLGDRVPLVLIVETADGKREDVPVQVEVRKQSTVDDHLQARQHR